MTKEGQSPLSNELTASYVSHWVDWIETHQNPTSPEDIETESKFFNAAEAVVENMNNTPPNPEQGRKGCVVGIMSYGENPYFSLRRVGDVDIKNPDAKSELDQDKINKYAVYAIAKALVLVQNPHLSGSNQNEKLPQSEQITIEGGLVPAGAFRIPDKKLIITVSGYNASDDEVVGLNAAVHADLISTPKTTIMLANNLSIGMDGYLNRYSDLLECFDTSGRGN